MNKGVLIFAQNSEKIDYALMSLISGGLAKKHLRVPVSLATDNDTITWMKQLSIYDKAVDIFDQIIETDTDDTGNTRKLKDGNGYQVVPFKNSNRTNAYKITPYEKTLLIDSDFLIFSNHLNNFWDLDYDIMISRSMSDLANIDRSSYQDKYVSYTGPHLYWATTVMFTKSKQAEIFFDLVNEIKENYQSYSEIYRYDSRVYRNDISFSIAKHIMDGFQTDLTASLPPVNSVFDSDILEKVNDDGRLIFLMSQNGDYFSAMSMKDIDVHIMNKQSIIRNADKLMELI